MSAPASASSPVIVKLGPKTDPEIVCQALKESGELPDCARELIHRSGLEGWTVVLWVCLLLVLPSTLIPIIHYAASDFNLSQTEFAVEILLLVIAAIVFVVALFRIFCKSCAVAAVAGKM